MDCCAGPASVHPLCLMALNDLVADAPLLTWQVVVRAQLVAVGTSSAGPLPEGQLPWYAHGKEAGELWTTCHNTLQEPNRHALLSAGSAVVKVAARCCCKTLGCVPCLLSPALVEGAVAADGH